MRNPSRPKLRSMPPRKSVLPAAPSTARTASTGSKRPSPLLSAKRISGVSKASEQEGPNLNSVKPTDSATQKQAVAKTTPQIPAGSRLNSGDSNLKQASSKSVSLRGAFAKWRPSGVTGIQRPEDPSLAKSGSSGGFLSKGRSGAGVARRNSETAVGRAQHPEHSRSLNDGGLPGSNLHSTSSSSDLGQHSRSAIPHTTYASSDHLGRRLSSVEGRRFGLLNAGGRKSRGSQDILFQVDENSSLQDSNPINESGVFPEQGQAEAEGPLRMLSTQSVSRYDTKGLNVKEGLNRRYSAVGSREALYSKPSDLLSPQTSLLHHKYSLRRSFASVPSVSGKASLRTSPSLQQQPTSRVSNISERDTQESASHASGSGSSTARSQEFGSPLITRMSETGSRSGPKGSNVGDVAATHNRNLPPRGGLRAPLLSAGRGSKEKLGSFSGSGPLLNVGSRLFRGGGMRPVSRRVPPPRAMPSNRPVAGARFDPQKPAKLASTSPPLSAHRMSPRHRRDLSSGSSSRSPVVTRSEESCPETKALAKFSPKWLASAPSGTLPSTTGDACDPRAALKTRLVPSRRAFWTGLVPTQILAPASSSLVASATSSPGRWEEGDAEVYAVKSPEAIDTEGLFLRRVASHPTESSTITLESTEWKPLFVAPFTQDSEDIADLVAFPLVESCMSAEEKAREAVSAASGQLSGLKEGFLAGQLQRTDFPSNVSAAFDAFICRQTIFKGEFPITIQRGTLLHPSVYIAALEGPIHIGEDNVFSEFSEVINRSPDPLTIGHRNIVDIGVKILDGATIGDDNHLETSCVLEDYASVENECIIGAVCRVSGRTVTIKSKKVVVAGGNRIVSNTPDHEKQSLIFGPCWQLSARTCDKVVLEKRRTLLNFIRSTLLPA